MSSRSHFVIRNDLPGMLILNIEPEGVFIPLGHGEEISVVDLFTREPMTVTVGDSDRGDPIVSLWPGDGEIRVEKGGINALDRTSEQRAQILE